MRMCVDYTSLNKTFYHTPLGCDLENTQNKTKDFTIFINVPTLSMLTTFQIVEKCGFLKFLQYNLVVCCIHVVAQYLCLKTEIKCFQICLGFDPNFVLPNIMSISKTPIGSLTDILEKSSISYSLSFLFFLKLSIILVSTNYLGQSFIISQPFIKKNLKFSPPFM